MTLKKTVTVALVFASAQPVVAQSVPNNEEFGSKTEKLFEFVESYRGRRMTTLGPNCFGTALGAGQVVTYTGYVQQNEFQAILNSPLCSESIEPSQPLQVGDILAVKQTYQDKKKNLRTKLLHASVWLGAGKVFEKASYTSSDPARVTSSKDSLVPFSEKALVEMRQLSAQDGGREGNSVSAFRCESLHHYLGQNHPEFLADKSRFFTRLQFEEKYLAEAIVYGAPIIDKLRAISQRLVFLERTLANNLAAKHTDLLKQRELHQREASWNQAPDWVKFLLLLRIQNMNKQTQLLINDRLLSR